jgi:hypothetical protein
MMRPHHDVVMRTTIDLPEQLHRIASAIARDTGKTLSQTIAELAERGLSQRVSESPAPPYRIDEGTGLPVVRSRRIITAEDVAALDDEA